MEVIIECKKDGKSAKMVVGLLDTVLEIKEKIEKSHDVPVPKQSLYIHGAAMADDDRNAEYYQVLEGSKIELVVLDDDDQDTAADVHVEDDLVDVMGIHDDYQDNQEQDEHDEAALMVDDHAIDGDHEAALTLTVDDYDIANMHFVDADEERKRKGADEERKRKGKRQRITFKIVIDVPLEKKQVMMDVDGEETVELLKEMIGKEVFALSPILGTIFALKVGKEEMQDEKKKLSEYGVVEGTQVKVVVKDIIKVTVMVDNDHINKTKVEVNILDKVSKLREDLETEHVLGRLVLPVPEMGYFFRYKEEVMDEKNTIKSYRVQNNDTIEVFTGNVHA